MKEALFYDFDLARRVLEQPQAARDRSVRRSLGPSRYRFTATIRSLPRPRATRPVFGSPLRYRCVDPDARRLHYDLSVPRASIHAVHLPWDSSPTREGDGSRG